MTTAFPPPAARPRSTYWRRRALLAAVAAAGTVLLLHACSTSGPPNLRNTVARESVPIVSTYTPAPPTQSPSPAPTANQYDLAAAGAVPSVAPSATPGPSLAAAVPAAARTVAPKSAPAKTPVPTAAPPKAAVPAAAAAAPIVPSCAKAVLGVSLRTDAAEYGGKSKPKLFIGIKNIGQVPCQVDLGSVNLRFTIRSGPDRIWSSADCQGKGTHDVRTLAPGQQLWARSVWGLVRSAHGCPGGEAKARPGTYTVEGSAAGVHADKKAIFRVR